MFQKLYVSLHEEKIIVTTAQLFSVQPLATATIHFHGGTAPRRHSPAPAESRQTAEEKPIPAITSNHTQ